MNQFPNKQAEKLEIVPRLCSGPLSLSKGKLKILLYRVDLLLVTNMIEVYEVI